MTPSGIEPVTSRFVAQHLNHCATAVLLPLPLTQPYLCTGTKAATGRKSYITFTSHYDNTLVYICEQCQTLNCILRIYLVRISARWPPGPFFVIRCMIPVVIYAN